MPARPKLTPEQKVALAIEILRKTRPAREICAEYGVSHTTAYEIRDTFLRGGREYLQMQPPEHKFEERLKRLERLVLRSLAVQTNSAVGRTE